MIILILWLITIFSWLTLCEYASLDSEKGKEKWESNMMGIHTLFATILTHIAVFYSFYVVNFG